jgi:hypothetical protein
MITSNPSSGAASGGGAVEGLERRVLLAAVVLNDQTGLTLEETYEGSLRISDVQGGFEVGDTTADDLRRRVPLSIEFTDVTTDGEQVAGVIDAGALGSFDFDGEVNGRRLLLDLDGEDGVSGTVTAKLRGGGSLLRGDAVLTDADGDELEGRVVTRAGDGGTGGGVGLNPFGQGVNVNALRRFGFGNGIDMGSASRFGFGSGVGVSSPLFGQQAGAGATTDAIVTRDDGLFNTTFDGTQIGSVFDF